MDDVKQGLLSDLRSIATIPVESALSPEADLSESSFSNELGQLTELSDRILEEVRETNRLYEEFFNPDNLENKENSSEKQALRPIKDSSSEVLSQMLGEIISVFAQLTAAVENMQQGSGGDTDITLLGGGKKGGLKKFLGKFKNLKGTVSKILPSIGRLATRAAGPLAIASGAAAFGKDAYDVATGSDGGANSKNIGGLIGSTVGAGIGVGITALLGLGTGGAGLLAGGAIVGGASGIGNMIGEFIGGQMDSTAQAETANKPDNSAGQTQQTTPYEGPSVRRVQPESSSGGSSGAGSSSGSSGVAPSPPPAMSDTVTQEPASVSGPVDEDSYTPPSMPKESYDQRLKVLNAERASEGKNPFTMLPPIEMGEQGMEKKMANVGPAGGAMSGVSEVPDPIYRGAAISVLSELYA